MSAVFAFVGCFSQRDQTHPTPPQLIQNPKTLIPKANLPHPIPYALLQKILLVTLPVLPPFPALQPTLPLTAIPALKAQSVELKEHRQTKILINNKRDHRPMQKKQLHISATIDLKFQINFLQILHIFCQFPRQCSQPLREHCRRCHAKSIHVIKEEHILKERDTECGMFIKIQEIEDQGTHCCIFCGCSCQA